MRSLCIAVAFVASSLAAHADTLTYNLNASFAGGGSVMGTLLLDNTTGQFVAANLTNSGFPAFPASIGGTLTSFNGAYSDIVQLIPLPNQFAINVKNTAGMAFDLINFNTPDFVGYAAASIPINSIQIYGPAGAPSVYLKSASASLQAVTPEPSSIALLGTGFLGVLVTVRKRFA